MAVKEVAFFAYSVKDVPKAVAFYRDVLGLTPGMALGDDWVEFEVGNVTFGIGDGTPLGYEPGKSGGMSLEVDDIEATTAKLKAAGTKVADIHDFPSCRAMFFKDPEGNNLALHQRKS